MTPATSDTLTAGEAPSHIGKAATICGKVYGTKFLASTKGPTFLNMDGDYPNNPFAAVLRSAHLAALPLTLVIL